MSGSGRSARRAGTRSRLGALGLALLPLLLTGPAEAQPVPPRCDGGYCIPVEALRVCDDAEARLPAVERQRDALRVEVRAVEARLAIAAGDRLVLSRALESQSELLAAVRQELRAVRPWLPGWAYVLLGSGLTGIAGLLVALLL